MEGWGVEGARGVFEPLMRMSAEEIKIIIS